MSGNADKLGVRLGHGFLGGAAPLAAAIGLFALGVAAGTTLAEVAARRRLRAPAAPTLLAQALLLAAFVGYGTGATRDGVVGDHGGAFYVLAALAAGSMGLQTSSLQRVAGRGVRTTYVTGVLTSMTQELVNVLFWLRDRGRRDEHASYLSGTLGLAGRRESQAHALLLAGIVALYVGGAALGSRLHAVWQASALLLPLAAICAIAALELVSSARAASPADAPDRPRRS